MVKLWVVMTSRGGPNDAWAYINPLHIRVVRDNGEGYSLVELEDCWYVVQGSPQDIARKITEAWRICNG